MAHIHYLSHSGTSHLVLWVSPNNPSDRRRAPNMAENVQRSSGEAMRRRFPSAGSAGFHVAHALFWKDLEMGQNLEPWSTM